MKKSRKKNQSENIAIGNAFLLDTTIIVIGIIGSIASVIALVMTIKINLKVKRLRDEFLQTARLPVLLERLMKHKDKIQELLDESKKASQATSSPNVLLEPFPDKFLTSFNECRADLMDLRSKLDVNHDDPIGHLGLNMRALRRERLSHAEIGDIVANLTGIIRQIENKVEDRKLDKRASS